MGKKLTKEEFVAKAIQKHGDKYGYDKVDYINSTTVVQIYCKACQKYFPQRPDSHLQGKGCKKCGIIASHPIMSLEEFVRRSKAVHGDKYDYSQVNIKTVNDEVTIICPEHGPFPQRPVNHYWAKQGCPKCGLVKLGMSIRSNTEEFIHKAREVHGDKYGYDRVEYVLANEPIEIYCPNCKKYYLQKPKLHLIGHGCTICANNKPIGTSEFIRRAKEVWGDRYTYEKTEYVSNKGKVVVTCREHGDWPATPSAFLNGHGCPDCGKIKVAEARKLTQEEFISRATEIHKGKYGYSKVIYINNDTDVVITCPIHGDFEQAPANHLGGQGCRKCKIDKYKRIFQMGKERFIDKAQKIHGDRYDYSQVEYVNNKTDVIVICPEHGPFPVAPQDHLQGMNGCPKCQTLKGEKRIILWLEEHGINYKWHKSVRSPLAPGKRKKFIPDFYVESANLMIEYNGEQHYRPLEQWGGEQQFKKQQRRDAAFREYCKQEGITLLEIPYTEFDRIESILDKNLNDKDCGIVKGDA